MTLVGQVLGDGSRVAAVQAYRLVAAIDWRRACLPEWSPLLFRDDEELLEGRRVLTQAKCRCSGFVFERSLA